MSLTRRDLLAAGAALPLGTPATGSRRRHPELPLDGAPGIAAGVVHDGRIVMAGGRGVSRRGGRRAPGADTIFEIGSLTKTFTAALIVQLEAEGRLSLDAPIDDLVPDLPPAWRPLSLARLLAHTSGLPEYLDASTFLTLMPQELTPWQIVALVADKPFAFAPGTRHAYTNTGYILLGMAAEAAGGEDYWRALARRFFRPAGMRSTGPRSSRLPRERMAAGHFWADGSWNDAPPIAASGATWAAGGLLSTVADMNRWSIALDEGRILSPAAQARMWRPATLADGTPAGWGHGWSVETVDGRTVVAHGGGTAGFSCWYRRDLDRRLSSILLTNQNGRADPRAMTDALLAQLAR